MTQTTIDSNPLQDSPNSPHPPPDAPEFVAGPVAVPGRDIPGRAPISQESHRPQPNQPGTLHALQSVIYLIVIAIFIITFCVQPFRIPSGSMEPALLVGDFLLVNKQDSAPGRPDWLFPQTSIRRGQIIVFHYPVNPSMHLVKRVVGLPGDRIKLRSGHVYVNDRLLSEPYAMYRPSAPDSYRDNFPRLQNADPSVNSRWWIQMRGLIENGELIIPPGNYFVLGDNRNDSEDSRYWGFVPRDAIVGQPFLIYFSVQQMVNDDMVVTPPSHAAARHHHRSNAIDALADFARWDRTLQVVK
ncbi:MAG: signal peptidase I [Edaphobacter sp.]